ncbi:alpha/beta hydrolase [Jeotgalibaca caeni]|uniref:alpha/beta hydrolase n=1 Tax=Jeotgalibaca caeni TaxID=3028623 RepID=UPI00237D7814|nr:alpha/beta hydrolase [Jeotgalibaca caeni]MDE1547654.1 alpha/beta hydrolase [Jeotgalibaca caeni]
MKNSQTHRFSTIGTTPIHLTYSPAEGKRQNKTIIYLHGGGFVYGTADDLPDEYQSQIVAAGYDFITLEYPLAPEATLDVILQKATEGVTWFHQHYQDELALESNDYLLFGRSAGAYLALQLAHRLEQKPQALLLFYGYHTLQEATFQVPSRHYLTLPKISPQVVKGMLSPDPIVNGIKEKRFSIYIYYRQTGDWTKEILRAGDKAADYSLSNHDLKNLPPAFLAASTGDPDVPYRLSKKMADLIPNSVLETVDSAEHDFDRTTVGGIGTEIYSRMLDWLSKT